MILSVFKPLSSLTSSLLIVHLLCMCVNFWLCLLFIAMWGLSLVVMSGGCSLVAVHRLHTVMASPVVEHPLLGSWASVVVVHRLSCSQACAVFPSQASNSCPLHWQVVSFLFFFFFFGGFCHTLKWNSQGFTCVPHPNPPSHLPLHPFPGKWFLNHCTTREVPIVYLLHNLAMQPQGHTLNPFITNILILYIYISIYLYIYRYI